MEDENGIELSLGLSCGSSTGKSKAKDNIPDTKIEEGGMNKLMGGSLNVADASFKHFISHNIGKQDSSGPQNSEQGTQERENFWTDLGKHSGQELENASDVHGKCAQFTRYQELWGGKNKLVGITEEKSDQQVIGANLWPESSNKRKMPFEEMKHQKKHEKELEHAEAHGKTHMDVAIVKSSHVSEDGLSAENEDVAESEVEVSASRLASRHDNSAKHYKGSGSDVSKLKDKQGSNETYANVAGNESGLELGNLTYNIPFSLQQSAASAAYSLPVKIPTASATSNSSNIPCIVQLMPTTQNERPTIQSMNPNNFQLAFGYSPVQLPTLDAASSSAFRSQQLSAFAARGIRDGVSTADHSSDDLKISQAAIPSPYHAPEETGASSSTQKEDDLKGNNAIFKPKENSDRPAAMEGLPHEISAIRPGIAAGLKFGGCGSYPDLPWVSTTGRGPNGKTISGVTYRYSQNQIRIVCACHGTHMSPEEFIQHASTDAPNQESNAGLASFPNGNPAASAAQS